MEQWNSRTVNCRTVWWNSDGKTVWWNSVVEQVKAEQCNGTVKQSWWNSVAEQCNSDGGTVQE